MAASWVSRYHSRHVRIALTKNSLPHLGMGSPNPLASTGCSGPVGPDPAVSELFCRRDDVGVNSPEPGGAGLAGKELPYTKRCIGSGTDRG